MRLHKLLKSIVLSVVSEEVRIRMGKQQADHLWLCSMNYRGLQSVSNKQQAYFVNPWLLVLTY